MDIIDIAIAKAYVNATADSLGAVTGAPCTIKDTTKVDGETTVTFEWIGTSGAKQTSQIVVEDGEDGVSVVSMAIDTNNHLICTMSDGSEIDAGELPVGQGDGTSGEDNKIESISVNGTTLTPDENKNVDITISSAPIQSVSVNTQAINPDVDGNVDITIPSTDGLATTEYVDNAVQNVQVDLIGYATEDFVTDTLVDYVAKEDGKGLSTNDLTDDLKTTYDKAVTDSHTHDNKDVIDSITEEKVVAWDKAEENVQSDWEQVDDTSDNFIKNKPEFEVLSEDDITALLGLSTEELEGLASILSDIEVRIDKTYSSSKIYDELNRVLEEGKTYTLEEIAKKSGASYKIASTTDDMTSTEFIYLLANGTTYDMYIRELNSIAPVKIGSTTVDLNGYYTAEKTDALFAKLTAIGDLTTLVTSSTKSLVDAINSLKNDSDKAYATQTDVGKLTDLKTEDKTSIVKAINELQLADYNATKTYATQTNMGDLTTLKTTDKLSIVKAINENYNTIYNLNKSVATKTDIGDLTILKTKDKTSIVNAINETWGNDYNTNKAVGDITSLDTEDKSSVVNAVNEIKKSMDELEPYTEVTQEEYDSIDNKMDNVEYRTTDTGHIYKNDIEYGRDAVICSTAPIGTVLSFAGQTAPHGYLLADGASYHTAEYPDLYAVIGNTYGGDTENFNVPDYRETVLVGVGENTTDTIASHDVYELGAFKDDQLQGHWHNLGNSNGTRTESLGAATTGGNTNGGAIDYNTQRYTVNVALSAITDGTNGTTRTGTTTHGKQKGVTYIIKAFHTNEGVDSGVSDEVINYVESELESAIRMSEDIEPTDLVFSGDTAYFDFGAGNNKYEVKNGICYFQVYIRTNAQTTDTMLEIVRGLPKPKFMRNFSVAPYVWANNIYTPLWACIDEDGVLQACKGGDWYSYFINGSYPIA